LIKSGAMDSLGPREAMLASVDDAIAAIQRAVRAQQSGQHGLFFGGASTEAKVHFELRDAAPWSEEERLASEYDARLLRLRPPAGKICLGPQGTWGSLARASGRSAYW